MLSILLNLLVLHLFYKGPFKVKRLAYELELPPKWKVHPVISGSQLEPDPSSLEKGVPTTDRDQIILPLWRWWTWVGQNSGSANQKIWAGPASHRIESDGKDTARSMTSIGDSGNALDLIEEYENLFTATSRATRKKRITPTKNRRIDAARPTGSDLSFRATTTNLLDREPNRPARSKKSQKIALRQHSALVPACSTRLFRSFFSIHSTSLAAFPNSTFHPTPPCRTRSRHRRAGNTADMLKRGIMNRAYIRERPFFLSFFSRQVTRPRIGLFFFFLVDMGICFGEGGAKPNAKSQQPKKKKEKGKIETGQNTNVEIISVDCER